MAGFGVLDGVHGERTDGGGETARIRGHHCVLFGADGGDGAIWQPWPRGVV
jgi:hypothetical protein